MVGSLRDASQSGAPRWAVEQVVARAPSPSTMAAAEGLAIAARWADTGCDDRLIWGRCIGSSSEPYDCAVDHVSARTRCSCASRRRPCKHALALLLLWVRHEVAAVAAGAASPSARAVVWRPHWLADWAAAAATDDGEPIGRSSQGSTAHQPQLLDDEPSGPESAASHDTLRDARDRRIDGAAPGLAEFDMWLHDCVRRGLADPALTQRDTWEQAAARLVDAKAGGLANRVRRVAAASHDHGRLLSELALLHTVCSAGTRLASLPPTLADGVATTVGWQVRQADVLAGVPITDDWVVMGRSDVREDRIEVRRAWLRGTASSQWAMVLSFAAYQQVLDESLWVGRRLRADVYRYPGPLGLRALVGRVDDDASDRAPSDHANPIDPSAATIGQACAAIGIMIAAEPWIERVPVCVSGAPVRCGSGWVLADTSGSLPLVADDRALNVMISASGGGAVCLTAEWTADGLLPLTVWLPDRVIDIGPRASADFVASGSGGGTR